MCKTRVFRCALLCWQNNLLKLSIWFQGEQFHIQADKDALSPRVDSAGLVVNCWIGFYGGTYRLLINAALHLKLQQSDTFNFD